MTVLVTGATGYVGRHVVDSLLSAGAETRAFMKSSDPTILPSAVQTFRGDLSQPDTLRNALAGAHQLYLFPYFPTADSLVAMAKAAGVRRVVTLSSASITYGWKGSYRSVEEVVERSGLEWTHVRPCEFALNRLYLWGPSIREHSLVREPFPDVAWPSIHERDIADVAVAALMENGHHGCAYTVNGPQSLSRRDMVTAIAHAVRRSIRLEIVSPAQARELHLQQGGFVAENADLFAGLVNYDGSPRDPDAGPIWDPTQWPLPTSEAVTGRPARTFQQWARDHASDFTP